MAIAADTSFVSRRSVCFILIVLLHLGLYWAIKSGLSHSLVNVVFGPMETRVIDEPKEEEAEPPPPPPKIETPPPFVPPPEVAIETAPAETTTAITNVTNQRPVATPPPAPAPVAKPVTVAPKSNPRRPLTKAEYPPASRRAGEEGTVVLAVYVLEDGRVGDVKVQQSSGFPRLDEAAEKEVRRSWRLTPGTQDGKPVAMWGNFAMTFKLTD